MGNDTTKFMHQRDFSGRLIKEIQIIFIFDFKKVRNLTERGDKTNWLLF